MAAQLISKNPPRRRREAGTRGACGARLETLVCARSDGGAGPLALSPGKARARSVGSRRSAIVLADRDLAIQDFTVVVVPSMRLSCLARARRERAALRAHREERESGDGRSARCLPVPGEYAALRADSEQRRPSRTAAPRDFVLGRGPKTRGGAPLNSLQRGGGEAPEDRGGAR